MQTYRRLASTATSTSRSASTASMHQHHPHGRLSRSSSTTSTTTATTITPVEVGPFSRMAIPRGIPSPTTQRNSSAVFASALTHDQYTHAELETIAESLLAHVTFGPYHLASSPVPSSHLRLSMTTRPDIKENITSTGHHPSSGSTTTPTLYPLGYPSSSSSQRHFEGKEGTHGNHPRARFTIGGGGGAPGESERGRGMGRKSLTVRDVNHTNGYERERGRNGNVKGLQYS